jgi:O-antigen ligase
MGEGPARLLLPAIFLTGCMFVLYRMVRHPGTTGGYVILAGLLGAEVLLLALWDYRARFFPLLVIAFLLGGMDVPYHGVWAIARWFVLIAGALAGFVVYLRDRQHHFSGLHLVALACLATALVSALTSAFPRVALLKTASLALLFIYGATGARLAIRGREAKFFRGLLWACEVLVYVSALSYYAAGYALYGNPNSLGAVMGIVVVPVLLWGVLIGEHTPAFRHRIVALLLGLLLLLNSYSRASIAAAFISGVLLCVALHRYRILAAGITLMVSAALVATIVRPLTDVGPGSRTGTLADVFLYKGKPQSGLLGSRQSPWDETVASVRKYPWFGTGFGTSASSYDAPEKAGPYASNRATTREHGDSYLAIVEWLGLLGVVPFFILIFLTAWNAGRVWVWVRRTGSPFSPAIPIAMVLTAGIAHAAFEDWMFAVGYYMCVFFWSLAFAVVDLMPAYEHAPKSKRARVAVAARIWSSGYAGADPRR